jgi:hypothetical protein
VAGDVDKLLKHIARRVLAPESALEIERDSSAANDATEIVAGQRRVMRDEEHRAEELAGPFRAGLLRADAARRAGGDSISLDDRKQDENLQADALIHFLVRADLATSRARETDQHRYIYTIAIDWEALERVARDARVELSDVLNP